MLTSLAPPTVGFDERIIIGRPLRVIATVTHEDARKHLLHSLENVQVSLTIEHSRRGDIEVVIVCPSGTELKPSIQRDLYFEVEANFRVKNTLITYFSRY